MNKIINTLINKIETEKPKILVLGDLMVDSYIDGEVHNISPEAPVPILNYNKKKDSLGGCGNVVQNLYNFGADISLGSIIGDDLFGELIKNMLLNISIEPNYLVIDDQISTTTKTRFVSNGQQLLRVDNDSRKPSNTSINRLNQNLMESISEFDTIIISDYNKGVCSDLLIKNIINKAKENNINVLIDPKGINWSKYTNAFLVTPNTKEAELLLNKRLSSDEDFVIAAKHICEKYNLNSCLITRGADGMTFYRKGQPYHQKVSKKDVFDVSGAGDSVIACMALCLVLKYKTIDCLKIASIISSEVVTHSGTTPFNKRFFENI